MTTIATDVIGILLIGIFVVVAGWAYASGPARRARTRRFDAWKRNVRRSYTGGESARGEA